MGIHTQKGRGHYFWSPDSYEIRNYSKDANGNRDQQAVTSLFFLKIICTSTEWFIAKS